MCIAEPSYIARLIDPLIDELFSELPAILLAGPRGSGKTTTARRHAVDELRLDVEADAALVRADPDVALAARHEPVLIDEWQRVPDVLGAVKRAVDARRGSGRFLLAGSTGEDLGSAGWPLTGRVVRLALWGLTEREKRGDARAPSILNRILSGGVTALPVVKDAPDLRGYVDAALEGAQPEVARQTSERARDALLTSYVEQAVGRDIAQLGGIRDPLQLGRYLAACAANTAGVVAHKTLYDAAGVVRNTGTVYDSLLESTFILQRVPAWRNNRFGRLTRTPKRYLVDAAMMRPLLGTGAAAVLRDGDLLGRVIDTFVASQLRAELAVSSNAGTPRLYHLRESDGRHEIDLVVEFADGRVIAVEVKAASVPNASMATHLAWFRDALGDRFVAGIVFHTGPGAIPLGDRVAGLPIAAIWA